MSIKLLLPVSGSDPENGFVDVMPDSNLGTEKNILRSISNNENVVVFKGI